MMEPQHDHTAFDAICAELDEFESIPTVTPNVDVREPQSQLDRDTQAEPIDEMILAGLVSL